MGWLGHSSCWETTNIVEVWRQDYSALPFPPCARDWTKLRKHIMTNLHIFVAGICIFPGNEDLKIISLQNLEKNWIGLRHFVRILHHIRDTIGRWFSMLWKNGPQLFQKWARDFNFVNMELQLIELKVKTRIGSKKLLTPLPEKESRNSCKTGGSDTFSSEVCLRWIKSYCFDNICWWDNCICHIYGIFWEEKISLG